MSSTQYGVESQSQRALQLMLDRDCGAGEAAFHVGYASPSQFSREFKRLFGSPPRRYLEQQRSQRGVEIVGTPLVSQTTPLVSQTAPLVSQTAPLASQTVPRTEAVGR